MEPHINRFKGLVAPLGWILPLVLAAMGAPFVLFGEAWRAAHWHTAAIIALHWVVILYLGWLLFERRSSFSDLPKVKGFEEDVGLITEHRSWLGIGVAVTIYTTTKGVERILCLGEVTNVQLDGQVQIRPELLREEDEAGVREVLSNPGNLGGLLIKPGPLRRTSL